MELANIRVNPKAIEQGAWVKDIPGLGDIALKVRGTRNADYERRTSELVSALSQQERRDPEVQAEIARRLLVETVLIDWRGMTENGKPVAYDRALAEKLLTEPEYRDFADGVAWAAAMVGRIGEEEVKASAKN